MTMVIENIPAPDHDFSLPDYLERDTVMLDWEERRKSRQRISTEKGREIAVALPTGTIINHGDILFVGDSFYIIVEAKEEDLIVISPTGINESARIAFELGNRHLPVSIQGNTILTPYSHDTENVVRTHGVAYERKKEIFEPAGRITHHVHP